MATSSSAIQVLGVIVFLAALLLTMRVAQAQTDEDLRRPYSFGFNIENMQHRQEQKDEQGIIQGEYGFFTSDGWYQTTIYATDEQGRFIIVGKKRHFIGPDPFAANRRSAVPTPSPTTPVPVTVSSPRPFTTVTPTTYRPPLHSSSPPAFQGIPGCGSCIVPTTTVRPAVGSVPSGQPNKLGNAGQSNKLGNIGQPNKPGNTVGEVNRGTNPAINQGLTPSGFRPNTGPFGDRPSVTSEGFRPTTAALPLPTVNKVNPIPSGVTNSPPSSRPIVVPDNSPNHNLQGESGPNYRFKYILGFHGHQETGFKDGSKTGDYFVNTRDGTGHKITYQANEFGYQPKVTQVKLSPSATPRKDTEKEEDGLKEYEFVWFKR